MIGCIGIGGVILVPALVSSCGYSDQDWDPGGDVCLYRFRSSREFCVRAQQIDPMGFGRPGFARAPRQQLLPAPGRSASLIRACLKLDLGLLTFLSRLNSLLMRRKAPMTFEHCSVSQRHVIWYWRVTGFLSSVSGTGGPLVLVPILIAINIAGTDRCWIEPGYTDSGRDRCDVRQRSLRQARFCARRHSRGILDRRAPGTAQSSRIVCRARYCVRSWQSFSSLLVFLFWAMLS